LYAINAESPSSIGNRDETVLGISPLVSVSEAETEIAANAEE